MKNRKWKLRILSVVVVLILMMALPITAIASSTSSDDENIEIGVVAIDDPDGKVFWNGSTYLGEEETEPSEGTDTPENVTKPTGNTDEPDNTKPTDAPEKIDDSNENKQPKNNIWIWVIILSAIFLIVIAVVILLIVKFIKRK